MSPRFLTLSQVLAIHVDQLRRYGGSAGIRDSGLLESALAVPAQTMFGEYLHRDLFEMAAGYLYHIVQNHPFIDGNKRTGAVASLVFLELNGASLQVSNEELERVVLAVASGQMNKSSLAEFLHSRCAPPATGP